MQALSFDVELNCISHKRCVSTVPQNDLDNSYPMPDWRSGPDQLSVEKKSKNIKQDCNASLHKSVSLYLDTVVL